MYSKNTSQSGSQCPKSLLLNRTQQTFETAKTPTLQASFCCTLRDYPNFIFIK